MGDISKEKEKSAT